MSCYYRSDNAVHGKQNVPVKYITASTVVKAAVKENKSSLSAQSYQRITQRCGKYCT